MVSEKTGFGKVEIIAAYVGKRKQVQKPMYGQQKNKLRQGWNYDSVHGKTQASLKSHVQIRNQYF